MRGKSYNFGKKKQNLYGPDDSPRKGSCLGSQVKKLLPCGYDVGDIRLTLYSVTGNNSVTERSKKTTQATKKDKDFWYMVVQRAKNESKNQRNSSRNQQSEEEEINDAYGTIGSPILLTLPEVKNVCAALKSGKSAGPGSIPAGLIKYGPEYIETEKMLSTTEMDYWRRAAGRLRRERVTNQRIREITTRTKDYLNKYYNRIQMGEESEEDHEGARQGIDSEMRIRGLCHHDH
ncbi:hypothetical protein HUJ04_005204 [Dendroctonus ponderosae]|nr:hypothetical protein HUJ04_005204 [Dendroctonus ponderosae]